MGKIMNVFVCLVVVCMWSLVVAQYDDAERTHFLEAFPAADGREFGVVAVESLAYEEKNVQPDPFVSACPKLSLPPDTNNVNQLKPGHIKVLMSMGDSITAGMSAKDTSVLNLREYRGISYAIGADTGAVTFANLLKQYTDVSFPLGVSTGIGKRTLTTNGFNGAVSGAINSDMRGQAEWLVSQLKAHNGINLAKDWKILTLWIGSNNLCVVCNNEENNNANDFKRNIFSALDYLYANVPRLFVNLLANMDITKIYDVKNGACGVMHPVECPCPSSTNAVTRNNVKNVIKQYVSTAYEIAANYTARKNPEFAVVVQPFLRDSPIYNRTFLSAADCFHPSEIAHQAISVALWNSIVTPAAQKKFSWDPSDVPICATADTLLYTN